MNNMEIYGYLMDLSLIDQLRELEKMWYWRDNNKKPPFMNSHYYIFFVDSINTRLLKSTSIFEVVEMIKNGATDDKIECLFIMNKLIE